MNNFIFISIPTEQVVAVRVLDLTEKEKYVLVSCFF